MRLIIWCSVLIAAGLAALACQPHPLSPSPTPTTPLVLTSNTILTQDMAVAGNAILIAADNIVLDLGGHTLAGPGKGPWLWPEPALSSVGIQVSGRQEVTIKNGTVENFATAILIQDSQDIRVEGVTTRLSHYGIYIGHSRQSRVENSRITANVYGLTLMVAQENSILRNRIFQNHHGSPGGYGICLISSPENEVVENSVFENQTQGLWLIKGLGNRLYHNNIWGNQPNGVDESGINQWHHPALKQGNYWGDYTGRDQDADGIGDAPYTFYEAAQDPFPLMKRDGWLR